MGCGFAGYVRGGPVPNVFARAVGGLNLPQQFPCPAHGAAHDAPLATKDKLRTHVKALDILLLGILAERLREASTVARHLRYYLYIVTGFGQERTCAHAIAKCMCWRFGL
jgi:hypothetical protein